jgi:dihydroorotase-like cyclic amidohydrolase
MVALEQIHETYWELTPGPLDVHGHPRMFDRITADDFVPLNGGQEGKSGLKEYTEVALRSGIVALFAMPNESIRRYDPTQPELTSVVPYPIASYDRVLAMEAIISGEAVIPVGVYMGLDPATLFLDHYKQRLNTNLLHKEFAKVQDECIGLKVYLAETTGGYNIALEHAQKVTRIWNHHNPEKPVVFHVEGSDTMRLLLDIASLPGGNEIPVHIAHVSSRQELVAVIAAKKMGMNVTCEATPHHLFLDDTVAELLGGYGCWKPGPKSVQDVAFLRANLRYIDAFASDCAPHRRSDKEAAEPAFGATNHTVMLPLLLAAAEHEDWVTMEDIYQKFCVAPRKRFNRPLDDGSMVGISTALERSPEWYEQAATYGYNPFAKLDKPPRMLGEIVVARAGVSEYSATHQLKHARPSLTHLIRPGNANSPGAKI